MSWFLYKVRDEDSVSFSYMWLASYPSTICWRRCPFPTSCFCLLCRRSVGCKHLGLFLGSLFCSIGLYAYFCTSTMLFCWLWPYSIVWNQIMPLALFFLLRITLATWVFCGSIEILWLFFYFCKEVIGILIGIVLNL